MKTPVSDQLAEHREVHDVLPWYVNRTLSAPEREKVDDHLKRCPHCRKEADFLTALAGRLAVGDPVSASLEHSLTSLKERLRAQAPFAPPKRGMPHPLVDFWDRLATAQVPALPAFGLLVIVAAVALWTPVEPAYHTLASPAPPNPDGVLRVRVVFIPEAPERAIRRALVSAGAQLVDGPTAGGVYTLVMNKRGSSQALGKLRDASVVSLAEPIASGRR